MKNWDRIPLFTSNQIKSNNRELNAFFSQKKKSKPKYIN